MKHVSETSSYVKGLTVSLSKAEAVFAFRAIIIIITRKNYRLLFPSSYTAAGAAITKMKLKFAAERLIRPNEHGPLANLDRCRPAVRRVEPAARRILSNGPAGPLHPAALRRAAPIKSRIAIDFPRRTRIDRKNERQGLQEN